MLLVDIIRFILFLYLILDCNCLMNMCCGLGENQFTLASKHTLAKLV